MEIIDSLARLAVGRRQPHDEFFQKGNSVCKATSRIGVFDVDDEELCHEVVSQFPCGIPECNAVFQTLLQFDMHYNTVHRYICVECKKSLPSAHLLELHVCETHDSFFAAQAERKPMYRCYVEECDTLSASPEERRNHCISAHKFPPSFRFDNSSKRKKSGKSKREDENAMKTDENIAKQNKPLHPKAFIFGRTAKNHKTWFTGNSSKVSTDIDMDVVARDLKSSLPD